MRFSAVDRMSASVCSSTKQRLQSQKIIWNKSTQMRTKRYFKMLTGCKRRIKQLRQSKTKKSLKSSFKIHTILWKENPTSQMLRVHPSGSLSNSRDMPTQRFQCGHQTFSKVSYLNTVVIHCLTSEPQISLRELRSKTRKTRTKWRNSDSEWPSSRSP